MQNLVVSFFRGEFNLRRTLESRPCEALTSDYRVLTRMVCTFLYDCDGLRKNSDHNRQKNEDKGER
jgi:hypothetical protein